MALPLALVALAAGPAAAAPPLASERVAVGLTQPLYVVSPPGDTTRLFIVEQPGTIRILDVSVEPPALLAGDFLDIQASVENTGGEQGLLGLDFHPDFATNRRFYVAYTMAGGALRISRFEVPLATPNDADETSEFVLMEIAQPQPNHNGGWLAFGPADGYLYIGVGDGGSAGDTGAGHTPDTGNAQDITGNLLGKILRIDADGTDGPGGTYGIPASNPFVGIDGDDEIWSFGLRNPWRPAFDPVTGDLYIADVGQNAWEEVSFQPGSSAGGENWGWRCREGAHDFDLSGPACPVATLLDPIVEYSHAGPPARCSITGGEVYRGSAMPALAGTYFYADFCSDQIWSLVVQGGVATQVTERQDELDAAAYTIDRITSFGTDAEGEIYIVDRGGEVFKIVPAVQAVPGLSPHGLGTVVLALLAAASFALRSGPRSMGALLRALVWRPRGAITRVRGG